MIDLILALITTITVEFCILWYFIRDSPFKLLIYSVLINSFSLPSATYIYIYILNNIFIVEIAVIIVESVLIMILMEIKYKRALFISVMANLITAFIGLLFLILKIKII
jgi:hypothetical protein